MGVIQEIIIHFIFIVIIYKMGVLNKKRCITMFQAIC